jgi:hypothetical protein
MQGVSGSSPLGSIIETPGPGWGFLVSGALACPPDAACQDRFSTRLHSLLHSPRCLPQPVNRPGLPPFEMPSGMNMATAGTWLPQHGRVKLTSRDLAGARSTVPLPLAWRRDCFSSVIATVSGLRERMEERGISMAAAAELLAAAPPNGPIDWPSLVSDHLETRSDLRSTSQSGVGTPSRGPELGREATRRFRSPHLSWSHPTPPAAPPAQHLPLVPARGCALPRRPLR